MGLREVAGEMARNTSGVWKGVADALDPDGRSSRRRPPPTGTGNAPATPAEPTIDLAARPPTAAASADQASFDAAHAIVPIDTWTRILEQVGNVHEAGQQLADARERAARAETENRFLKEQLAELKSQRRPSRRPAAPAAPGPTSAASSAAQVPETRVMRVRRMASGWLSP